MAQVFEGRWRLAQVGPGFKGQWRLTQVGPGFLGSMAAGPGGLGFFGPVFVEKLDDITKKILSRSHTTICT